VAWNGFSFEAFRNLWGFFRLSLASAVMLWWVNSKLEWNSSSNFTILQNLADSKKKLQFFL
jgi:hypothetical protein